MVSPLYAPATFLLASQAGEGQLRAQALGGDRDAWNALFARHNRRVVIALVARGIAVDRAKDHAQEAWIRVMDQQRKGRLDRLSLPGLAIVQALLLAREQARRAVESRAHVSVDHDGLELPDGLDVGRRLVSRERLSQARQVLAGCHPTARAVFQLMYEPPGRRPVEVAEQLQLSVQRVRQIVCEVRRKLRDALPEDER